MTDSVLHKANGWPAKLAVLSISTLLMSAPTINGALPSMRDALHISQAQVEALSTLPNLSVVVFILLSSFIADKIGMKKTVTIGLLLACVGGCLPVFVSDYYLLAAGRLILGAGLGLFNSLAVSLISSLYKGNTRASMLGARNSVESMGQAVLTFVAGLLLNLGWHFTFAVYLFAIPLIFIFVIFVPDIGQDKATPEEKQTVPEGKESLHAVVYFLVFLAIVLVMNSYAVTVRFPSIAAQIKGANYNASTLLSFMPILGIVAGFLFGKVHKYLGQTTIYVGMALYVAVNLLFGLSGGNFVVLLIGLFLSGIPNAWCFPYVYNTLGSIIKTEKTLNLATSLILVGCNIGGFIAPYVMQLIQSIGGSDNLQVPFPVFAVLNLVLLVSLVAINKHMNRQQSA